MGHWLTAESEQGIHDMCNMVARVHVLPQWMQAHNNNTHKKVKGLFQLRVNVKEVAAVGEVTKKTPERLLAWREDILLELLDSVEDWAQCCGIAASKPCRGGEHAFVVSATGQEISDGFQIEFTHDSVTSMAEQANATQPRPFHLESYICKASILVTEKISHELVQEDIDTITPVVYDLLARLCAKIQEDRLPDAFCAKLCTSPIDPLRSSCLDSIAASLARICITSHNPMFCNAWRAMLFSLADINKLPTEENSNPVEANIKVLLHRAVLKQIASTKWLDDKQKLLQVETQVKCESAQRECDNLDQILKQLM